MMTGFLSNSKVYEVQAANQVSVILSQFDSGYIMDVVEDTLKNMFEYFDIIPKPNIVQSFETTFKELHTIYPNDIENINQTRIETYQTIIEFICKKYSLRYIQTETIDTYTIAYYLYDFFVAKWNMYMVQFYVKYILNEKESFIPMLNMEEFKKSTDINIKYNKMAFSKNDTLALIAINIPEILKMISNTQIMDQTIYSYIYSDQPFVVDIFESTIAANVPIFTRYNSMLFNEALYGPILTHIRMQFQQMASQNNASIA